MKSFCEKITDDDDEQEQSYGYVPLVDPEVPSGEIKKEMCLKPTCFDLFYKIILNGALETTL